MIKEAAHKDAKIFWGVTFDESMKDEVEITVIATQFDKSDVQLNMGNNESNDFSEEKSFSNGKEKKKSDDLNDDDDFFVHLTSKLNSFNTYDD